MTALERRSVTSLALLYNFRMLGLFMVLPLLALYAADFEGATPALIGIALGVYGLSQALLQIPFGWLSDRVGRKPVIIAGLLIFAAGSVLAAVADSIYGIIAGRVLQGAGAIASSIMALVADLTREEQRTKAMAVVGASIGLAFALALVLGPVVAGFGGLEAVFGLTALLALAGIAIVVWQVPAPDRSGARYAEVGTRSNLVGRSLRNVTLLRLDAGVFTLHFILMAIFQFVPGMLQDSLGIAREDHWQVYLPVVLLSVLGMLPMMRLAERGGRPHLAFVSSIVLLLVALATLGLAHQAWLVYGGLWVFFVGFNYLEAALPSMVSKAVFADGKGTALGIYSTSQFLGVFAGGVAGGWVLQRFGVAGLIELCLVLGGCGCCGHCRLPALHCAAAQEHHRADPAPADAHLMFLCRQCWCNCGVGLL
ncbi:MFS transporter [Kineobactrum salinum]|uniref:MFS transporter n=1 Tax=Kineobactrum salinum TaxID=2708301 RepID=UPI001E65BD4A|nr:MFS transporter [Kineobactrum salinum]